MACFLRLLRCQSLLPTLLSKHSFPGLSKQTRGKRRTCKPASWYTKRKVKIFNTDLSKENKEFLEILVKDKYSNIQSPLKDEPWNRGRWTSRPLTMRTGVLAVKIGVMPQWTKLGKKITTTLLQVLDNHVINYYPPGTAASTTNWHPKWTGHYGLAVVGALSCDPHLFDKSYNGLFTKAGVPPKRKLTRFLVTANAAIQPGTPLTAMHYRVGDYVDVQAKTIGHGFQGVKKRWRMKGLPASHGVTKAHNRIGSIAGGKTRGGIWKGKKMPGHMGMERRTLRGLRIWRINLKYNILYVQGGVPGPNHCYVRIMDSMIPQKRPTEDNPPPMPTYFPGDSSEPLLSQQVYHEELFRFTEPSITYTDEEKA